HARHIPRDQGAPLAATLPATPASVFLVLRGPNAGGFDTSLPVVDSLPSSSSLVTVSPASPPPSVSLFFLAHDPDPGSSMTFTWASSCTGDSFVPSSGSVRPVAGNRVTSAAPSRVPLNGAPHLSLTRPRPNAA